MFTYMYLQTQKPRCISSDKCLTNLALQPSFPKGGVSLGVSCARNRLQLFKTWIALSGG